jgi:hypothetical protein
MYRPADPVQQNIHPGQRVLHPEQPPDLLGDAGQCPALIRIPGRRRPGIQDLFQLGHLDDSELALHATRPLDASAFHPPAASARRHRFTGIRETRNRFAISRSLTPGLDQVRRFQPELLPAGLLR